MDMRAVDDQLNFGDNFDAIRDDEGTDLLLDEADEGLNELLPKETLLGGGPDIKVEEFDSPDPKR